ncbi:hypothetical protein C8R46DRAFT_1326778 [Mycena filopes]|nr:hypothetical protein C8R46DRAFT_1326778 [Mycena filopes]
MAASAIASAGQSQLPTDVDGGAPSVNFELMFAPLLFGVILNAMLFGVFIVQVNTWFRIYKGDFGWIRYLIHYLIVLETINTICDVGLIYQPLIQLRNSPSVLIDSPTFLAADPIVTVLISTPVQLFMAWRIRRLTKSNWLSGLVALVAFLSLVGGVGATIGVALNPQFAKIPLVEAHLTLWLTSSAFADLFITTFMVNFIWKNKTGFKTQTDSVADKIIFFTVQTGTLTSFAAISDVTLFLLVPTTTFMFIWDFSLSKLYSVCLIATLNAREEWNGLLEQIPAKNAAQDPKAIVKVRRATDVQGLQLYIPSQFAFGAGASPRKRTPHPLNPSSPLDAEDDEDDEEKGRTGWEESQWVQEGQGMGMGKGKRGKRETQTERATRTAEWALRMGAGVGR